MSLYALSLGLARAVTPDPVAFAQVCLYARVDGGEEDWPLYGCPASPAPLPASSQPRSIRGLLPAWSPLSRADLRFDGDRLTAIERRFADGATGTQSFDWGADGQLVGFTARFAPATGAPVTTVSTYRRDGDRTTIPRGFHDRVLVTPPTGPSTYDAGPAGPRWSLQREVDRHVATCTSDCGAYSSFEVALDPRGFPIEAHWTTVNRGFFAGRIRFEWAGDRLVGVDRSFDEQPTLVRVADVVWPKP